MRYRIFAKRFLHCYENRTSFDKSLLGKNPDNPVGGMLHVLDQDYVVNNYREYAGTELTENKYMRQSKIGLQTWRLR